MVFKFKPHQAKIVSEVATEPRIRKKIIPEVTFLVRASGSKITSERIQLH